MSRRKQHPLIIAMNKFEQLLNGLDEVNVVAFIAYVQNKVNTRPKGPRVRIVNEQPAPRAGKKSSRFKDSQTAHAQSLETGEAAVSLVDVNAIGHSA